MEFSIPLKKYLVTSLSILFIFGLMTTANADTFIVNSDQEEGDGICDQVECTVGEALEAAKANPGEDLIDLSEISGDPSDVNTESELETLLEG